MGDKEPSSTTTSLYNMLISFPVMTKMLGLKSVKDLAMERLIIKMKEDAPIEASEKVIREIISCHPSEVGERLTVKKDNS